MIQLLRYISSASTILPGNRNTPQRCTTNSEPVPELLVLGMRTERSSPRLHCNVEGMLVISLLDYNTRNVQLLGIVWFYVGSFPVCRKDVIVKHDLACLSWHWRQPRRRWLWQCLGGTYNLVSIPTLEMAGMHVLILGLLNLSKYLFAICSFNSHIL